MSSINMNTYLQHIHLKVGEGDIDNTIWALWDSNRRGGCWMPGAIALALGVKDEYVEKVIRDREWKRKTDKILKEEGIIDG